MFDFLMTPEALISLATLTAMEVVLGIDNIIFISILVARLPEHQREKGRKLGILGALVTRLALLSVISWIVGLTQPLATFGDFVISGKSLILFFGGLFLLYKATHEIHEKLEGPGEVSTVAGKKAVTFASVIMQVMFLDVVFSLDSVITAVGMTQHISIMVIANIVALAVMLAAGKSIGDFVSRHPTVKMLALSFLLMIGFLLIAEGLGFHIPKGYAYFAMGFSVLVEMLNLRVKSKAARAPVELYKTSLDPSLKN